MLIQIYVLPWNLLQSCYLILGSQLCPFWRNPAVYIFVQQKCDSTLSVNFVWTFCIGYLLSFHYCTLLPMEQGAGQSVLHISKFHTPSWVAGLCFPKKDLVIFILYLFPWILLSIGTHSSVISRHGARTTPGCASYRKEAIITVTLTFIYFESFMWLSSAAGSHVY